nr:Isoquinoline 1-oxidoreductase subunit [Amylibacter sp.]
MTVRLKDFSKPAFGLLVAIATVSFVRPSIADTGADTLRNPADFAHITAEEDRSKALFTEMGKVIESPRCMNCHPRGDSPTQFLGQLHVPPVSRGPAGHGVAGLECSTCHGDTNVTFPDGTRSIPGNPDWHLAPATMAWQGSSLGEICAQLKDPERNGGKTLAEIHHHTAEDPLVGWGWTPGVGRAPAPGSQEIFSALTLAWIETGAACPDL